MNRICIFLFVVLMHLSAAAQSQQECVRAVTDSDCYVVGEHLMLNVEVLMPDGSPSPSCVAYVEIADTAQLHAQAMLTLDGGRGFGEIALPTTMHSGAYQLCVYTRGMRNFGEQAFFNKLIGVINPAKLSPKDNIRFLPADDGSFTAMFEKSLCNVGRRDARENNLPTQPFTYELEGHIVSAHVDADSTDIDIVYLALVGKTTMVYDGRLARNGDFEFFTSEIHGEQPSLVSAYSHEGASLPTRLISPFAQVLPSHLPLLTVKCTEQALNDRYTEAMRQKAIDDWRLSLPMPRKATFMAEVPQHTYDLDEWTSMNTVREMLREFIRGVHAKRFNGVQQLYISPQFPALVLFDGIPIYDVEKFLDYDARLLKYVQIYDDRYTFGKTFCHGVVSFVSRSGRLTNFTLDQGSSFASYQFPQPHQ